MINKNANKLGKTSNLPKLQEYLVTFTESYVAFAISYYYKIFWQKKRYANTSNYDKVINMER